MPLSWINRDGKLIIMGRACRLFAQGPVVVLLIIYLDLQGISLVQSGLIISAGLLGGACYSIFTAFFANYLGRRRLLTFFTAARVITGLSLATITSFPILAVIIFLTGFTGVGGGGGALQPLAQAILADSAPAHKRNDLYAVYNMFAFGGTAVGTLLVGMPPVLQGFFGMSELGSYKVIMLWYALFNLVATVLAILLSPAAEVSGKDRRPVNPLTLPSRRKMFSVAGLYTLDHAAGSLVIQSLIAFWFVDRFGVDLQSLALIFFASNIGVASSFWIGAKLANRFGLINTMVLTHLPSGLLLMALPFVPSAWSAVALWLAYSLTRRMAMPMRQSFAMAIVEPHERVAMATANSLGSSISMIAGPPVAAFLLGIAAAVPFIGSGAMQIVGDLLLYRTFRKVKPPEEPPQETREMEPAIVSQATHGTGDGEG